MAADVAEPAETRGSRSVSPARTRVPRSFAEPSPSAASQKAYAPSSPPAKEAKGRAGAGKRVQVRPPSPDCATTFPVRAMSVRRTAWVSITVNDGSSAGPSVETRSATVTGWLQVSCERRANLSRPPVSPGSSQVMRISCSLVTVVGSSAARAGDVEPGGAGGSIEVSASDGPASTGATSRAVSRAGAAAAWSASVFAT